MNWVTEEIQKHVGLEVGKIYRGERNRRPVVYRGYQFMREHGFYNHCFEYVDKLGNGAYYSQNTSQVQYENYSVDQALTILYGGNR